MNSSQEVVRPPRSRIARYSIAAVGLASFGLAVLGALLPGLPTTVFLIVSSFCFSKSCPHLYERLMAKIRLLRPYLAMLESDQPWSNRARARVIAIVWFFISMSVVAFGSAGSATTGLRVAVILSGVVGTIAIMRFRRASVPQAVQVSDGLGRE